MIESLARQRLLAALVLSALLLLSVLPVVRAEGPEVIHIPSEVRSLPGELNKVDVVNSNSPEVVQTPGVLVGVKRFVKGRFDVFAHHIAKCEPGEEGRTLYIGIVVYNLTNTAAKVDVLAGASYLSQPDAPFIPLAASLDNADGDVFAGPGDRVTDDVLRGKLEKELFPQSVKVPANSYVVMSALPVPVLGLTPHLNGRSLLLQLHTDQHLAVSTVAAFSDAANLRPADEVFIDLVRKGELAGPRERPATPPNDTSGLIVYGRVAGIAQGDLWTATIPVSLSKLGESVSFPICSLAGGTFGTGQVQSAPLLAREPDTAYLANGNYGVKYDITIQLDNTSRTNLMALIKLQTPVKTDQKSNTLSFYKSPPDRIFFRGTVRSSFTDAQGIKHEKYTHLVQRHGDQALPLVAQYLLPKEKRTVRIELVYPPDATPPQMLTIESADPESLLD